MMKRRIISIVLIFLIALVHQVHSQSPHVEVIPDDRTIGPVEESESPNLEPIKTPDPEPTETPILDETTSSDLETEPPTKDSTEPVPPTPAPNLEPLEKFICDSPEKSDALKDLKRVMYEDKHFYLLASHLAIQVKIFTILGKAGGKNYGDEDQLVITEPMVRKQENEESVNGDGERVFGYLYLLGASRDDAMYYTRNYEGRFADLSLIFR